MTPLSRLEERKPRHICVFADVRAAPGLLWIAGNMEVTQGEVLGLLEGEQVRAFFYANETFLFAR